MLESDLYSDTYTWTKSCRECSWRVKRLVRKWDLDGAAFEEQKTAGALTLQSIIRFLSFKRNCAPMSQDFINSEHFPRMVYYWVFFFIQWYFYKMRLIRISLFIFVLSIQVESTWTSLACNCFTLLYGILIGFLKNTLVSLVTIHTHNVSQEKEHTAPKLTSRDKAALYWWEKFCCWTYTPFSTVVYLVSSTLMHNRMKLSHLPELMTSCVW